jgi:hypothetical protein
MESIWWALAMFVGGGSLGILLMSLMNMSGDLPEQVVHFDDGNVHPDMMGPATEY